MIEGCRACIKILSGEYRDYVAQVIVPEGFSSGKVYQEELDLQIHPPTITEVSGNVVMTPDPGANLISCTCKSCKARFKIPWPKTLTRWPKCCEGGLDVCDTRIVGKETGISNGTGSPANVT